MADYPYSLITQATSAPWLPGDNGLLAANADPWLPASSSVLVAGTVYLAKLPIRTGITITNVWWVLATVGAGASTGSFTGVYSSAGTLLSGSADIAASFTGATGPFSVALTTPQTIGPGFVWVAIVSNLATTQPAIARSASQGSAGNMNLTAANFRFAINGTVQTSLPASITPASNASAAGTNLWAGVN
jgi:hypothetical protein